MFGCTGFSFQVHKFYQRRTFCVELHYKKLHSSLTQLNEAKKYNFSKLTTWMQRNKLTFSWIGLSNTWPDMLSSLARAMVKVDSNFGKIDPQHMTIVWKLSTTLKRLDYPGEENNFRPYWLRKRNLLESIIFHATSSWKQLKRLFIKLDQM